MEKRPQGIAVAQVISECKAVVREIINYIDTEVFGRWLKNPCEKSHRFYCPYKVPEVRMEI